jgi:hypothetical protein
MKLNFFTFSENKKQDTTVSTANSLITVPLQILEQYYQFWRKKFSTEYINVTEFLDLENRGSTAQ